MSGDKVRSNQSGEELAVDNPLPSSHGSGSTTTAGGKARATKVGNNKNDVESPLPKNHGSGWATMSGMSGGKARGNQSVKVKNAVESDNVPHQSLPKGQASHVGVGARKSPPENL